MQAVIDRTVGPFPVQMRSWMAISPHHHSLRHVQRLKFKPLLPSNPLQLLQLNSPELHRTISHQITHLSIVQRPRPIAVSPRKPRPMLEMRGREST